MRSFTLLLMIFFHSYLADFYEENKCSLCCLLSRPHTFNLLAIAPCCEDNNCVCVGLLCSPLYVFFYNNLLAASYGLPALDCNGFPWEPFSSQGAPYQYWEALYFYSDITFSVVCLWQASSDCAVVLLLSCVDSSMSSTSQQRTTMQPAARCPSVAQHRSSLALMTLTTTNLSLRR